MGGSPFRLMQPSDRQVEDGLRTLLTAIGENPDREGLLETPKRVLKAFREFTRGLQENPILHLEKNFSLEDDQSPNQYDGMIISSAIPFTSLCEHHLMPFVGHAYLAYVPGINKRVVGLSKLARVVEGYAQRLQVQERLTVQIRSALQSLEPEGVGVVIVAKHSCQHHRGIKKMGRW